MLAWLGLGALMILGIKAMIISSLPIIIIGFISYKMLKFAMNGDNFKRSEGPMLTLEERRAARRKETEE